MSRFIERTCSSTCWALTCVFLMTSCPKAPPPLKVSVEGESVIVSLTKLGDYPSQVSRIRVVEIPGDREILNLEREAGNPQLWKLKFSPGKNSATPSGVTAGSFEVRVPSDRENFFMESGAKYQLEAWGPGDRKSMVQFTLPPVE